MVLFALAPSTTPPTSQKVERVACPYAGCRSPRTRAHFYKLHAMHVTLQRLSSQVSQPHFSLARQPHGAFVPEHIYSHSPSPSPAAFRRPLAAGRGHCGVGTRSPAATAHRRSSHARGRAPTDVICVVRRSVMDWKQSNFVEDVSASPSRASAIGPRRKTSSC